MTLDRPLYLNADKTRVVEEGDLEARYVLGVKGSVVPPEYRNLPGLPKESDTRGGVNVDTEIFPNVPPPTETPNETPTEDEEDADPAPLSDTKANAKAVENAPENKAVLGAGNVKSQGKKG
jgi:hypothetical protein